MDDIAVRKGRPENCPPNLSRRIWNSRYQFDPSGGGGGKDITPRLQEGSRSMEDVPPKVQRKETGGTNGAFVSIGYVLEGEGYVLSRTN